MSKKYGVPPATLKRWYKKFKSNPSWRPYDPANHGMHNRYFTDEEEHSIAEFIRETFINQGLLFTNADFRVFPMQAFLEKGMITHPNEIDESDDYYSDNEEEPNNNPENDEEADDENEAEFDFQEEAADPVDEMLH